MGKSEVMHLETETSEGVIPHRRHRGMDCPVALQTWTDNEGRPRLSTKGGLPIPEKDASGALLFALPGGGRAAL